MSCQVERLRALSHVMFTGGTCACVTASRLAAAAPDLKILLIEVRAECPHRNVAEDLGLTTTRAKGRKAHEGPSKHYAACALSNSSHLPRIWRPHVPFV